MWRFLTLVGFALLLASTNADARLFSAAGAAVPTGFVCQFLGSTTDESCITPANTLQTLGPVGGHTWAYTNTGCDANTPQNCPINAGGSSSGFTGFEGVYRTSGPTIYINGNFPTCGEVWRYYLGQSYLDFGASPGTKLTGYFTDNTSGLSYGSSTGMLANASASDTLTVSAPPAPYACWPDQMKINTASLTINFAANTVFADNLTSKGALVINGSVDGGNGNNVTLDGASGVWIKDAIRVGDAALNSTIENMTVGTQCETITTSCILTGNNNGTVTLTNLTVHEDNGGVGSGQEHNIYVSAQSTADDNSATVLVTNVVSYDPPKHGWTLKMRSLGQTTQNHVTTSTIGCQSSGVNCVQNGVVDMPCWGNYKLDHNTLERGPDGDNWYILRIMEEQVAPLFCPPCDHQ